ncbi:MAG: phosphate ABC transporter, permease protein PstA [Bdellovibrionales bacterium GWA2_49_15]|nr:MAG: phosphate ABC transporter, permease protein PstA [Bdellovibrionales bacterium GWA2_49_15]HAZ13940.1 phosphate ABC transporter permease PtsA [Bdellovibrionales bacterium]
MKARKRREIIFQLLCACITIVGIILLFVLLYHVVLEGWKFLTPHFFTDFQSRFPVKSGMKAGIYGSLWMISITAITAIPLGIASAIFLEEYAPKNGFWKMVELNISNLAGVPSIVYGLLGLSLFVRALGFGQSVLSGALTMALLVLPVIIVSARESIRAVPLSLREAAFALGAAKYQVLFGQILPVAIPGILTGIILALGRAFGEAAPLIIVGALSYVSFVPENVNSEFTVMPIQIYNWSGRPQEEFHQLAATGIIVLLLILLSLNLAAIILRDHYQKRFRL